MEWIEDGLQDFTPLLIEENVQSIAIPPLGAGNGGLNLAGRSAQIESAFGDLQDVDILIYQPTEKYQNVAKSTGVKSSLPPEPPSLNCASLLGIGDGVQPTGNPETGTAVTTRH